MAELPRNRIEIGELVLDQREPPADLQHQTGAVRNRGVVAVNADHLCIGCCKNRLGITAGAERTVEIDAARSHVELLDRGSRKDGNMTGRSASKIPAAARLHFSAPIASSESGQVPRSVASPRSRAPNRAYSQICHLRQP